MEKIKSSAEFGGLVKKFKKNHKGAQSNCFFLPAEVEDMAGRGKLYYEEKPEGLYFLVTEESCARLYYYVDKEAEISLELEREDLVKNAVILDYVFRGDEEAALQKAGYEKWLKKGFAPYKRYRRMECVRGNFNPPEEYFDAQHKFHVEKASPKDYQEISSLWKKSLDVYSTFLLEKQEFEESCERGEIVAMRLSDGTIFAVGMVIKKGKTAFLQHLAVEPSLRGNGMGKAMFCANVTSAFEDYGAEKANFWVDEQNSRAIGMYKKGGFIDDGTVSSQFILEKK